MTFNHHSMETRREVILIPTGALRFSGFGAHEAAEYRAMSDTVVVLKKEMDPLELYRAFRSLTELMEELANELQIAFSDCDGNCEDCPYDRMDFPVEIEIPERLRARAGLSRGASLFVREDAEDVAEAIREDESFELLREFPGDILRAYVEAGVCPAILENSFMVGDAPHVSVEKRNDLEEATWNP